MNGSELKPKLYKRRWIFLAALAFMNGLQTFATLAITQVNNVFVAYFHISYALVDWGSIGNFAGEIMATLPTAWFVFNNSFRVRHLAITCSLLLSVGLGLMTCSLANPALFPLLVLGQIILGIRNAVALALVPAFTVQWFPDTEVGSTFAMFLFGGSSGLILGVILPSHVMYQPLKNLSHVTHLTQSNLGHLTPSNLSHSSMTPSNLSQSSTTPSNLSHSSMTTSNLSHSSITLNNFIYSNMTKSNLSDSSSDWLLYDRDVALFLYGVPLLLSLFTLALFACFMTDRPPSPPTLVQARQVEEYNNLPGRRTISEYFNEVKSLFSNQTFLLSTIAGGLLLHTGVIEFLTMSQMFRELFRKTHSDLNPDVISGDCVALFAVGALIGAPISAWLVNKFQRCKLQLLMGALGCCVAATGVLLGFHYGSIAVIWTSNFFYGFAIRIGAVPVLELVTQASYPMREAFVGSFYVAIQAVESIALAEVGRVVFNATGREETLIYQVVCLIISVIVAGLIQPAKKRREAEKDLGYEENESTRLLLPKKK